MRTPLQDWAIESLAAMNEFRAAPERAAEQARNLDLAHEVTDGWAVLHRRLFDPAEPGVDLLAERERLIALQAEWLALSDRIAAEFATWYDAWRTEHPKPGED